MYEYPTPGERPGGLRLENDDRRLLLSNVLQVKLGLLDQPDNLRGLFREWFDKDGAGLVAEELRKLSQEQIENGEGMEALMESYRIYQQGKVLH